MHPIIFVIMAMSPTCLFMVASLPVRKRVLGQELVLLILWVVDLVIPLYYAGEHSYICLMSTSVWSWATGMKMAVWLFSMSMDERRKRRFVWTLFYWRIRTTPVIQTKPDEYIATPLWPIVTSYLKRQLLLDILDLFFRWADTQHPIRVFQWALNVLSNVRQNTGTAVSPAVEVEAVAISFGMCAVFSIFLQLQLQVAYDAFLILYALLYRALSIVSHHWERRLTTTKNIKKSKNTPRWSQPIQYTKNYLEDVMTMPPLFDSPWSSTSLHDFWSRRWHKTYNDCFYRLGYVPTRHVVRLLLPEVRFLRRALPTLAAFVLSGLMHEYFLYCATGPALYFRSTLGAGGWQFLFFTIQVGGLSLGDALLGDGWLGGFWAVTFMVLTSHLFVMPYLMTGYMQMNRFSILGLLTYLYHGTKSTVQLVAP